MGCCSSKKPITTTAVIPAAAPTPVETKVAEVVVESKFPKTKNGVELIDTAVVFPNVTEEFDAYISHVLSGDCFIGVIELNKEARSMTFKCSGYVSPSPPVVKTAADGSKMRRRSIDGTEEKSLEAIKKFEELIKTRHVKLVVQKTSDKRGRPTVNVIVDGEVINLKMIESANGVVVQD